MQSNQNTSSLSAPPSDEADGVVLYLLSSAKDGDARPAPAVDPSLPRTRNTLPCFYYWRKSARDGDWVNPERDFNIKVTPEMRRQWQAAFVSRENDGDETPIVEDHNEKAASTLGYVKGVKQDGPWYWELHQYLGEEARDKALRNKISVAVKRNYQSNTGKKYPIAVQHSAITPRPTISGTGEAVALVAAGRAIYLSRTESAPSKDSATRGEVSVAESDLSNRRKTMADKQLKCSEATLAALHKHVPGLRQVDDDEKLGRVAQHLATVKDLLKKLDMSDDGDSDAPTMLGRIELRIKEAEKKAAAAEGKLLELGRGDALERPTDREVYLTGKVADGEWASAVASGGISAAIVHELKGVFRKDGRPTLLALSRSGASEDPVEVLLASILKRNKPTPIGEKAGIQALARLSPGDDANPESKSDLPYKEMIARLSGGECN